MSSVTEYEINRPIGLDKNLYDSYECRPIKITVVEDYPVRICVLISMTKPTLH